MNECFDKVEGIAVDTHVFRIAHRLKFSAKKTPGEVERDLLSLLPKELWKNVNSQWIRFGREYCIARKPHCADCPCVDLCPTRQNLAKETAGTGQKSSFWYGVIPESLLFSK